MRGVVRLQTHRMISEIAYGWGFTDMTHFARRFKAAYRLSPSDWRRNAKGLVNTGRPRRPNGYRTVTG